MMSFAQNPCELEYLVLDPRASLLVPQVPVVYK